MHDLPQGSLLLRLSILESTRAVVDIHSSQELVQSRDVKSVKEFFVLFAIMFGGKKLKDLTEEDPKVLSCAF